MAGISTEADKKALDYRYGIWHRYKYDSESGKIQVATSEDYNPETGEGTWSSYKNTSYTKYKEPGKSAISKTNPNAIAEIKCTEYNYKISSKITIKTSDGKLISDLLRSSSYWQWLATAYTRNCSNGTDFSVRRIGKGEDSVTFYNCLWSSDGTEVNNYVSCVRPVVTLKLESELVESNGTYYLR